jgi:hypothetical protein
VNCVVLFIVCVSVCTVLLPPGVNPIAVKYIISYHRGKIQGRIEVTGRQGRRRSKLLDDLKERRGYSHLKEEALDRTVWRARFGRGFGPVVRQTTKWIISYHISYHIRSCHILYISFHIIWYHKHWCVFLSGTMTKKCTNISQFIKFLHVSTLSKLY